MFCQKTKKDMIMSKENVVLEAEVVPSKEEKNIAVLCVLLQFLSFFTGLGGLIGPLVLWLLKKDESRFVDAVGKEAVNLQITVLIVSIVGVVLSIILIGFLVLLAVAIYTLVVVILAALKANEGKLYRYPVCFRFIK